MNQSRVLTHARPGRNVTRRSRWIYALATAPPLAALLTILLAPDPHGHWSEHLWGVYLGGTQLVLLAGLAAVSAVDGRWRGRWFSAVLALCLAVIAAGIVLEMIGNYQVAESIWRTTGNPGYGNGYVEGHDRAATGDLLVIAGSGAFAVIFGVARRARPGVAAVALVMAVIPPPWIWPALGVLVLLLGELASESQPTST